MTEKDLLNNREAMKLALAFDKMAKEYKTTNSESSNRRQTSYRINPKQPDGGCINIINDRESDK